MSDASSIRLGAESELHRFWPAILACFVTAVFGWGFGFSGPSVYLAELQRAHGWSTGRIAAAITAYYLLGALCLARVDVALRWFGARYVVAAGTVLLGLGASLFARSQEPWELYVAAVPMALGWAGCTSTAISTTLALYFHRQRGLAITLALNGASAAGFTIGPLLVELSQNIGVGDAVPLAVVTALAVVLPLIWFGIKPAGTGVAEEAPVSEGTDFRVWGVERTWRFWSIALPFALVLAAQVGLIVHLVSFLLPRLGADGAAWALSLTSVAAVSGRLLLAGTIDRLHQRRGRQLCEPGCWLGAIAGLFHHAGSSLRWLSPVWAFRRQHHHVPGPNRAARVPRCSFRTRGRAQHGDQPAHLFASACGIRICSGPDGKLRRSARDLHSPATGCCGSCDPAKGQTGN
jgi:predicted MFS family arabinose efflux permease